MKNTSKAIIELSNMVRNAYTNKLWMLKRYDAQIESAAPMRTTAHKVPGTA